MRSRSRSADDIARQLNRRLTNAILRGNEDLIEHLAPHASLRTELRTGKIWMRPRTPDHLSWGIRSVSTSAPEIENRIALGGPFEAAVMMGVNVLALRLFRSAGPERHLSHDRNGPSPLMVAADLGDAGLIRELARCSDPGEWMHIATDHGESAYANLQQRRDEGLNLYEAAMLGRSSSPAPGLRRVRRL